MRSVLIVLAGACASLVASTTVWLAIELPESHWFEVVDHRLLRTNAPEYLVNTAVESLMREGEISSGLADFHTAKSRRIAKRSSQAEFTQHLEAWFSQSSLLGESQERVHQLTRERTEANGQRLQVKVIGGEAMPTLVFIEDGIADEESLIAERLGEQLAAQGVQRR